jgi:hypothetical protein
MGGEGRRFHMTCSAPLLWLFARSDTIGLDRLLGGSTRSTPDARLIAGLTIGVMSGGRQMESQDSNQPGPASSPTHEPLTQRGVVNGHALPHVPQFALSLCVVVQNGGSGAPSGSVPASGVQSV